MPVLTILLLALVHAILTLLLLNLFLQRVPLPADGRRIRTAALPWLLTNGAVGVGVAGGQAVVGGWGAGALCLAANLYLAWLLWKFGLRKQFPYENPLG